MKTKLFLIFFVLFLVLPLYCGDKDQAAAGRTTFEVIGGLPGGNVNYSGARYTYKTGGKTVVGWGVNFYKLDDGEQDLYGDYISFGPLWRYRTNIVNGFGLQFSFDLWFSLFSHITSTPGKNDLSYFHFEMNPELLFFIRVNFGRNACLCPAAGICAILSYFKREEVDGYSRGIIESRAVFKLPFFFPVFKKNYILIEPSYKYHLYSSKYEKMPTFTVKMGFSW